MAQNKDFRIEHDTMGEVLVPINALYGAQTQRAVENFPISGSTLEPAHIAALAQIKKSAALANAELGVLNQKIADSIAWAADQVISGKYDDQFPIDIYQTGSGTSSNMNANEVIATLAARGLGRNVSPNDHVNCSQSSNDVIPSAIHVSAVLALRHELLPALEHLADAIANKGGTLGAILKTGRTHQIRVHLASQGHPIAGDDKYGDFDWNRQLQKPSASPGLKRMFLHAWRLQFSHPVTAERVALQADLPPELKTYIDHAQLKTPSV